MFLSAMLLSGSQNLKQNIQGGVTRENCTSGKTRLRDMTKKLTTNNRTHRWTKHEKNTRGKLKYTHAHLFQEETNVEVFLVEILFELETDKISFFLFYDSY